MCYEKFPYNFYTKIRIISLICKYLIYRSSLKRDEQQQQSQRVDTPAQSSDSKESMVAETRYSYPNDPPVQSRFVSSARPFQSPNQPQSFRTGPKS